ISLRLNRRGTTRGLCGHGVQVHHVNDQQKVVAFHRWDRGGPHDEVIVVANFSSQSHHGYRIGFPHSGRWTLRFNSDWDGYSPDFSNFPSQDVEAHVGAYDYYLNHGDLAIAPYSVLIYSQD
ncbi:alpha amylase C-terminal domain-containing protein, partial [Novipirellula sp.]|uniref:alpha amylase C-terminal domain-containing protein n=1 Tax=Novipirellula sp. TaxID=2795430 RepID=UPI00356334E8